MELLQAGFGDTAGDNWIGECTVNYNRTLRSYKAGFGDAAGDNWIGECTVNYNSTWSSYKAGLVMPPEITGSVSV